MFHENLQAVVQKMCSHHVGTFYVFFVQGAEGEHTMGRSCLSTCFISERYVQPYVRLNVVHSVQLQKLLSTELQVRVNSKGELGGM